MADHDPLCPFKAWSPDEPWAERKCLCEHNAKVRADERERIAQEIERYDAEVCDLLGAPCTCAAAAGIARGQS